MTQPHTSSLDPLKQPEAVGADHEEHGAQSADVADSAVPVEPDEAVAVGADEAPQPEPEPPPEPEPDPLAEAERERDQYLDHLRRERAEFENFRKRANRERMDALDRGAQQVVANLLGVLDTLGFALAAARDRDADDQLAKGVEMLHAQLLAVLIEAGLEEIDGVGSHFDPMHHEAVMQVEAKEAVDEPTVVEVLRPGYRFKGRVLRPASVKVAK